MQKYYKRRVEEVLRWRKRIRRITYIITDFICILLASIAADLTYTGLMNRQLSISSLEHIGFFSMSTLLFMGTFLLLRVYDRTIEQSGHLSLNIITKMLVAYAVSVLLLGSGLFYMKVVMSRLYIGTFTSYILVFQLINRAFMHSSESKDNSCSEVRRNILVIGQSPKGAQYIKEIQKHSYLDCEVVGYISITDSRPYPNLPNLGRLDQLVNIVTEHVIDEITVARPLSSDIRLQALLNQCQSMGITITMLLDVHTTEKAQVAMVGNLPVLKFHAASLNESQLMMKHMLDIIGGMVGTVIFGLVFLFLGPIIKLESSGPVIFKQDRVGKNGRVFQVWKFRSMGVDAETQKAALAGENEMSGHMFKMTNDPRVTRVGAFIRKTSIDELPQFYNVLKGDMSLVGTRPPTVSEVKAYEQYQRRRICITPGITGKWQVSGRSDVVDFEEVLRLDSEYIENWSIWSDIKILFKTIVVVFGRRGSK